MSRLCGAVGAALCVWLAGAGAQPPPAGAAGWLRPAVAGLATVASGWVWPLAGRPPVVRGFAPPATPYGPGHRGVDLAALAGSPVFAAGAGVVGYVGPLAGRGVVTVLHSDGLRTTYEPVLGSVHVGQHVAAGDRLGTVVTGHLDCAPAACLHWGLLRGQTYLDPLLLLGAAHMRLLPRAGPPLGGQRSPRGPPGTAGRPAGDAGNAGGSGSAAGAVVAAGVLTAAGAGGACLRRRRSLRTQTSTAADQTGPSAGAT